MQRSLNLLSGIHFWWHEPIPTVNIVQKRRINYFWFVTRVRIWLVCALQQKFARNLLSTDATHLQRVRVKFICAFIKVSRTCTTDCEGRDLRGWDGCSPKSIHQKLDWLDWCGYYCGDTKFVWTMKTVSDGHWTKAALCSKVFRTIPFALANDNLVLFCTFRLQSQPLWDVPYSIDNSNVSRSFFELGPMFEKP